MTHIGFFFRLFGWFILRPMGSAKGRTLTVLLGVALGAAVFTSVRLAVHASLEAFHRNMDAVVGRAEQTVLVPGGRVPESLVARLLSHRQVKAASPISTTYVRVAGSDTEPFLLLGFDPLLDRPLRHWRTTDAETPVSAWLDLIRHPGTFIAGSLLAERNGWKTGETTTLLHAGEPMTFRMVGVMAGGGLSAAEGGMVALCDIATFQEFTGWRGAVDRIDLILAPGETAAAVQALKKDLPKEVQIRPASRTRESGRMMIRAYQLNLSILSFASLFVGTFLVYSLVALNAASRRKETAILRSLGASPRMVFALFLVEGTALGLMGWLLAIPVSGLLLPFLLEGVSETVSTLFVRVSVPGFSLSAWEVLLSFTVTVAVAGAAAVQPSAEAMKVPPREVLAVIGRRGVPDRQTKRLTLAGLLMIAGVWPLARLPGPTGLALPGYAATMLLFIGFAMISPAVLRRLGRSVSIPLRRLAGTPAYLAGRYVKDSGTRTAVSVGALITAVALFVSLVIMIHSFRETVKLWVEQTVSGDLFVASRLAEVNDFRDPMTRDQIALLHSLSDEAEIVASRRFSLLYDGRVPYTLQAMAMDPFLRHGDFVWMRGDARASRPALVQGRGVVISEVFANRTGLSVGDRFRQPLQGTAVKLPVLGIIRDYRTQGGVVFFAFSALQAQLGDVRWTGARLYLRDSSGWTAAELRNALLERGGGSMDMVLGKDLRGEILRIFDETFAVTTVLLFIALAVAALGIATTLTILVLERYRELNTLYAVGGSSLQLRTMILWEALLIVSVGEAAGLVCGFLLSHILIFVINRQSFGWTFLYRVDWSALALSVPLVIAVALAAALPAFRAVFRQPPAAMLRER
ncbi:MAG: ABC transporter permease [Desulfobacteraceae bacterium]|nr:ABC transporter permease [Desulfobacteraceae bacterium]